ncbi:MULTISPECIES: hypothetical protein [Halorussus]|uniref:hypothetical protein n=1 Tax=Halorussus TaxID=1070314 RepID=UPI000E219732|nr:MULTISPECIES: hypothetical protein [Halorussus]NHN61367.1 hypothetical protein [Halorussus sp. JP-T4]
MSPTSNDSSRSSGSSPNDLPDDLVERVSQLDESEIRALVSYARSQLPQPPTVEDLLEERPGEEILDVEDDGAYTRVVKMQRCADGCEDCPHGPYLYHVRVEPHPGEDRSPSLHWEFLGPVR